MQNHSSPPVYRVQKFMLYICKLLHSMSELTPWLHSRTISSMFVCLFCENVILIRMLLHPSLDCPKFATVKAKHKENRRVSVVWIKCSSETIWIANRRKFMFQLALFIEILLHAPPRLRFQFVCTQFAGGSVFSVS